MFSVLLLDNVSALMMFQNLLSWYGNDSVPSNSPTYALGSSVNILWSPPAADVKVSLVMWQANETTGQTVSENFEYLTSKRTLRLLRHIVSSINAKSRECCGYNWIHLDCRDAKEPQSVHCIPVGHIPGG